VREKGIMNTSASQKTWPMYSSRKAAAPIERVVRVSVGEQLWMAKRRRDPFHVPANADIRVEQRRRTRHGERQQSIDSDRDRARAREGGLPPSWILPRPGGEGDQAIDTRPFCAHRIAMVAPSQRRRSGVAVPFSEARHTCDTA